MQQRKRKRSKLPIEAKPVDTYVTEVLTLLGNEDAYLFDPRIPSQPSTVGLFKTPKQAEQGAATEQEAYVECGCSLM